MRYNFSVFGGRDLTRAKKSISTFVDLLNNRSSHPITCNVFFVPSAAMVHAN